MRSDTIQLTQSYLFLIWFLESIYAPIVLFYLFHNEFKKYKWDKIILIVGSIASLITILLIYNPELNEYVRYSLIQSSAVFNDEYEFIRGYGFAEGLRGTYAMIQGLILGICLYSISKNWLNIFVFLIILISIAFNARTGLVTLPISILIILCLLN